MIKMKQTTDNTQKCELVLKLEDNIVCQRYFTVRNFNPRATNSLDLHENITELVHDFEHDLRWRTLLLLDSNHRTNISESKMKEEYFTLTINKGTKTIYTRCFRADIYPPKVRFTVDIRPQVFSILRDLTQILSSKKVTTYYQDYNLITS